MATQFLQSNLWETITSLATTARNRYVAIAYLGSEAIELLPLTQGDLLIVNMSVDAVSAHQTNPVKIGEYLRHGVEVHSCSNLHAKVFVFDNTAIISSSNASKNSRDHLIEAAVLTTDTNIVNSVRDFILSLRGELVTPEYVRICESKYNRPPPPPPRPSKIQIRLSAYDHRILDQAARRIVEAAEESGSRVSGPVPLQVSRPAHLGFSQHIRTINLIDPDKKTMDILERLSLPTGVEIEMTSLLPHDRS